MTPVAILFGVATAVVVAWCFLGGRRDRWVSAAASVVMATGWAGCRAAEILAGWDVAPDAYALVDLFSAFAVSMLWARSERPFLIPLALIFTSQSALHLAYQTEGRHPGGIYPYLFALDVLYAAGLFVLAFGGRRAADVLVDLGGWCVRWLCDLGSKDRSAVAGRSRGSL